MGRGRAPPSVSAAVGPPASASSAKPGGDRRRHAVAATRERHHLPAAADLLGGGPPRRQHAAAAPARLGRRQGENAGAGVPLGCRRRPVHAGRHEGVDAAKDRVDGGARRGRRRRNAQGGMEPSRGGRRKQLRVVGWCQTCAGQRAPPGASCPPLCSPPSPLCPSGGSGSHRRGATSRHTPTTPPSLGRGSRPCADPPPPLRPPRCPALPRVVHILSPPPRDDSSSHSPRVWQGRWGCAHTAHKTPAVTAAHTSSPGGGAALCAGAAISHTVARRARNARSHSRGSGGSASPPPRAGCLRAGSLAWACGPSTSSIPPRAESVATRGGREPGQPGVRCVAEPPAPGLLRTPLPPPTSPPPTPPPAIPLLPPTPLLARLL